MLPEAGPCPRQAPLVGASGGKPCPTNP